MKFKFDGQLLHITGVRLRVVGSGNLDMVMSSLDDVYSTSLMPLALASSNNREPTQLTNFVQQRVKVRIGTNEINEWFNISRMMVFVKTFGTSFPG